MPEHWLQELRRLTDFTAATPDLRIEPALTVIPAELRATLYGMFDSVRRSFIEETASDAIAAGQALGLAYNKVKAEVMGALRLSRVELDVDLTEFLRDPVEGLMPLLYDPLFDILKGISNPSQFEESSGSRVSEAALQHLNNGFAWWTVLALVSLLRPNANFEVPFRDEHQDSALGDATPDHLFEEQVPEAKPSERISFQQRGLHQALIVPKVLIYSDRLKRYVALHFRFNDCDAYNRAKSISPNQEWLATAGIQGRYGTINLWPDIAIYSADGVQDISLVADYLRILRPSLTLEIREQADCGNEHLLNTTQRHNDIMKPHGGSFIIYGRESLAGAKSAAAMQNPTTPLEQQGSKTIRCLKVGYDQALLEPVIQALG